MAKLTTCKACGREVSRNADKCPHCGEPLKKGTLGCGGVAVLVLAVMVLTAVLGGRDQPKQPEAPPTAEELRTRQIEKQFSAWDGSHRDLATRVKAALKDPDSYQHIETKYIDNGAAGISVIMKYRAKNSFGGYVVNSVVAKYDNAGNLIEGPLSVGE